MFTLSHYNMEKIKAKQNNKIFKIYTIIKRYLWQFILFSSNIQLKLVIMKCPIPGNQKSNYFTVPIVIYSLNSLKDNIFWLSRTHYMFLQ